MSTFAELQEYASHFYPLNKENKIKLTGIELEKNINDKELELFLKQSPFITFLKLNSTEITKTPRKEGLKTLICQDLTLEEFIPPLPIPNISLKNCPNLKIIDARESKNIMPVNNSELTSLNFDKPERVFSYKCKKLKIDKTADEKYGKILITPNTSPLSYRQLTTYFY